MLEVGSQFGPYRIEGVLGRGGMGMVFEATQLSLRRVVALKVVAPGLSADFGFRERFRREGPMQARIDHPHIVPVYEAGEHEGHLFIAMRLVRGPTLKAMIIGHELDPRRSLRLLGDVADALDTAHEDGLIHRDVKPSNILVGPRDHAFLCDFGLTKEPGSATNSLTKSGHVVGTLDYIAPEQIQGEDATAASDVYAFAAVLYETLTGQVPFPRRTDAALLYAHVSEPPPRATELRPDLPPALDEVIRQGMAKNPAARPASPLELIAAADAALGATRPPAPHLPLAPRDEPTQPATPPEPASPPAMLGGSTVSDRHRTEPGSTETAMGAPLAPGSTETDVGPPPGAPSTETDVGPPPGAPSTETDVARAALRASTETDVVRPVEAVEPTLEPEPRPADADREGPRGLPVPLPLPSSEPAVQPPRRTATAPTRRIEPPPGSDARGRPRLPAVAAAIALVLAGAAGAVAGSAARDEPVAAPRELAARAAALDAPAAWTRRPDPTPVPGLTWTEPAVAAGGGGEVVVGALAGAGGRLLLPAKFVAALPAEPQPRPVRLGEGVEAYRYAGLAPAGTERRLDLHVVPTDEGVIAVSCVSSSSDFLSSCARAAATLRVERGEVYPLGPDPAYGTRLKAAFRPLGRTRLSLERSLRQARTPKGQARAAARLADTYRTARSRLGDRPRNPTVRAAAGTFDAALLGQARAYDRLAEAAAAGSERAYRRARPEVRRADASVQRAVDGLREIGYDSSSG